LSTSASKKPNRKKSPIEALNAQIIEAISNLKGKNIVQLDLRKIPDAPVDYFIICEGDSVTQVRAICDNIYKEVLEHQQTRPDHIEGARQAQWVLVDYFNTVVHVFHPEARKYYELEDMWSDAEVTQYENL
jgi:ribosome-associated protein